LLLALPLESYCSSHINFRWLLSPRATLCYDKCGICTRSFPPQCRCIEVSPTGCIPACKTCAKSTVDGHDNFQCKDLIANFCKTRCTKST
ncbi:hypothetical protein ZWY2020_041435, partial [Hordeum vulgare]